MATDTAPDFDLGPLSWVQGEIDQALTRGLESLGAFRATGKDLTALKHARTHVHQAAGAIQMVGLDAVVAFTDEIERQLARLEELPPRDALAACDAIDRACRKLRIFLDELVNGAPPVPLKLFPEYEAMQRGARRQGRGADRSLLSRPRPARAEARHAAGDSRGEAPVVPGQAAPPLPARPARLAARRRRRRRREDDARRGRRHRGRDDAAEPARVLVDRRRAARRALSSTGSSPASA